MPFSRGYLQPRDQTQVSHIAGRFFYHLNLVGYFDDYCQILELFPPLEEKNSSMTFL